MLRPRYKRSWGEPASRSGSAEPVPVVLPLVAITIAEDLHGEPKVVSTDDDGAAFHMLRSSSRLASRPTSLLVASKR